MEGSACALIHKKATTEPSVMVSIAVFGANPALPGEGKCVAAHDDQGFCALFYNVVGLTEFGCNIRRRGDCLSSSCTFKGWFPVQSPAPVQRQGTCPTRHHRCTTALWQNMCRSHALLMNSIHGIHEDTLRLVHPDELHPPFLKRDRHVWLADKHGGQNLRKPAFYGPPPQAIEILRDCMTFIHGSLLCMALCYTSTHTSTHRLSTGGPPPPTQKHCRAGSEAVGLWD